MKKNAYAKRTISMLVCVCLCAAFLFTAWFAAAHIHHDCTGNDCPVCMLIYRFSDMIRKMGAIVMLLAAALLAALTAILGSMLYRAYANVRKNTPVSLKVQLNN